MANRLANLPGLRVVRQGSERVGGAEVAWVEVAAPGVGDALAPSGRGVPVAPGGKTLRPTREVVVAFLRPADTVSLVWHAPEDAADALASQVRETLKTLEVRQDRPATQSY
jgi:hypothetical protein